MVNGAQQNAMQEGHLYELALSQKEIPLHVAVQCHLSQRCAGLQAQHCAQSAWTAVDFDRVLLHAAQHDLTDTLH